MKISLNLYNEDGRINSEKLSKATDAIFNGIARINTLSLREEQGRCKGGRRNVETSLLLAADRRAGRGRQENNSRQEIIEGQENLLRQYAEEKGIWLDEAEIKENSLIQLPSGFESNVYVDLKGEHVIKVTDYRILDNTPQSFIDNRISLYNSEFQETFYELIGFTENNERFKFIVKQPYIQARSLDFNTENDLSLLRKEMEKRGYKELAPGVCINKDYVIYDVRNGNVKLDAQGNFYFIDVVPKLNTLKPTGGSREYGNGDLIFLGNAGVHAE